MKVLFVCSGNSEFGISPIVESQCESLRKNGVDIEYFAIQGKGIIGYIKNIPKLRKKIKSISYDLIHAHYGYSGIVA
ncbi:MAG: glycosyltransferase, partial [Candidatus Hodarchaeota archaeon]